VLASVLCDVRHISAPSCWRDPEVALESPVEGSLGLVTDLLGDARQGHVAVAMPGRNRFPTRNRNRRSDGQLEDRFNHEQHGRNSNTNGSAAIAYLNLLAAGDFIKNSRAEGVAGGSDYCECELLGWRLVRKALYRR
jgi:hypothetical protein